MLQEDLDSRGCGKVLVNQMQRELILLPYAPITWWETGWPRSLRASQSEKDGKRRSDDLGHFVPTYELGDHRDHHFLAELMASPAFAEALEAFCNKDCRGRPQTLSMSPARLTISSWNCSPSSELFYSVLLLSRRPGILLNCSRRYFGN